MPDRDSVIEALGQAIPFMRVKGYGAVALIMLDALALLKEQEPMKPKEGFQEDGLYYASCGDCGYPITELRYLKDSFCPHCGRKVKKDG